ncbi:MAG TPA: hypothetical protein PKA64_20790, partial [Myxococcota bacterium]|nr:hypothetical protein [Myxococcota bacterium]
MASARTDVLQLATFPVARCDRGMTRVGDQLVVAGLGASGFRAVSMDAATGQAGQDLPLAANHVVVVGPPQGGRFGGTF